LANRNNTLRLKPFALRDSGKQFEVIAVKVVRVVLVNLDDVAKRNSKLARIRLLSGKCSLELLDKCSSQNPVFVPLDQEERQRFENSPSDCLAINQLQSRHHLSMQRKQALDQAKPQG
jgi:hypothetical protein